jgi:nicotinamidase-related amidase
MSEVLLVVDAQNDFFEGGRFPLWEPEAACARIVAEIARAHAAGTPVVLIQHVEEAGGAPFFEAGTPGVALHPHVVAAAPTAPVVVTASADAFEQTSLAALLVELGATSLRVCGMMTQHGVAYTIRAPAAEGYPITLVTDACATVSPGLHDVAVRELAGRVTLARGDGA